MKEKEYLEKLRRKTGYYKFLESRNRQKEEIYRQLLEQRYEISPMPASPEELASRAFGRYSIMYKKIKEVLDKHSPYDVEEILVTDLPFIGLNGLSLRGPKNGPLIVVDMGLHLALVQVGTILSESIELTNRWKEAGTDPERQEDFGAQLDKLVTAMVLIIAGFSHHENKELANELGLDQPVPKNCSSRASSIGHQLADVMNCFILGHEIAHHLLGHTRQGASSTDDIASFLEALSNSREQELEADRLGFEIVFLCGRHHMDYIPFVEIEFMWFAIPLFFRLLEVSETISGRVAKNVRKRTHPSATVRREHALERIPDKFARSPNLEVFGFMDAMFEGHHKVVKRLELRKRQMVLKPLVPD